MQTHQNKPSTDAIQTSTASYSQETSELQSPAATGQTSSSPNSFNSNQWLQLQRTIGNRAVGELLKRNQPKPAEPTTAAAPAENTLQPKISSSSSEPTIQRQVYIERTPLSGDYRHKTKSSHGNEGAGDRNVGTMLGDAKSRYFLSKDEMLQYAAGTTDKIGYVAKTKTWVRLPDELLVLGEYHTDTTLSDVVKATGTNKYMHEGFTEFPPEAENNPALQKDLKNRDAVINEKFKGVEGGDKQRAESFYPKILRALNGVKIDPINFSIQGADVEMDYLAMAIHFSSSAEENSALFQTYSKNQDLWDQTASQLAAKKGYGNALSLEMKKVGNSDLFIAFMQDLTEYAQAKIKQEQDQASKEDKDAFQKNWHVADPDYSSDANKPIMKAENARDFSMFQHIKKAKSDGYLLYGLGNLHLERLKELLDQEGIKNKPIDTFLKEQDSEYPQ